MNIDRDALLDQAGVVRCKDCQYSDKWNFFGKEKIDCTFHKVEIGCDIGTEDDGFCNYGIRRETDATD